MKTCHFCGKKIPDDAAFCRYCGNPQETSAAWEGPPAGQPPSPLKDGAVCPNCGTVNDEENQFCRKCGASLDIPHPTYPDAAASGPYQRDAYGNYAPENKEPNGGALESAPFRNQAPNNGMPEAAPPKKSKKWLWGGLALASLFLLITTGALFAFLHLKGGKKGFDLSKAELVENYVNQAGDGTVDLAARDRQPAARNLAARWDSQTFYWLEDVGQEDDNHIADCVLTRMELSRQDNGKILEYEVYRDPDTDEIYKIVSIETMEDKSLELSDYYYQDGKPNFVFRRSDSVYTPSYASIDKVGERYYFSDGQMVKWRWIYEPSVVKQWILEPEDTWYTQWAYGEISDGERAEYDEKELQVYNEACHTYEAVMANPKVTLIEGRVVDEEGDPLEGVEVGIGTIEAKESKGGQTGSGEEAPAEMLDPAIKLVTDKNGRYAWAVDDAQARYFLVFQKDGRIPALMEPALIPEAFSQAPQDDLTLLAQQDEKTVPVTFLAYKAGLQGEDEAQEAEETETPPLADASVTVYEGVNLSANGPAAQGSTNGEGRLSLDLPPGVYTAEVRKEGFTTAKQIFVAGGEENNLPIYIMEEEKEAPDSDDVWSILLQWEAPDGTPLDLDSSLFTPDKAEMGDRNCVNTLNRSDNAGARLLYDGQGKNPYESITLTAPKKGSYKYYVTNYTDILAGAPSTSRMADSHAKVTLCRNGSPVKTFTVPNKEGTVWEVFELRNRQVVPIQEVYGNAQGKSWWTQDKQMARITEDHIRASWIQSDGEWLYFANSADDNKLYYCRKDGSELTKFCDDRLVSNHILLLDNQIYYAQFDGFGYLSRINTDGTGHEILTGQMDLAEGENPLEIRGYKDGILYYYHSPETVGGIGQLSLNGKGEAAMENSPQSVVSAGSYLYYVSTDHSIGLNNYSFYRQKADGSERECLQADASWWYGADWTIYKGWIYYTRNGSNEIRCMRLDGSGDMSLASNAQEWSNEVIVQDDYCYYIGNDNQIYRVNVNNGRQTPLISGNKLAILDGEIYTTDSASRWSPILACSKDGGNQRPLYDTSSSRKAGAMKAYAQLLDGYVPTALFGNPEKLGYIRFACEDIDGDGINELFIEIPTMGYPNLCLDYFRYEDSLKKIWDGKEGGSPVAINMNKGEMAVYYATRNDYIDRYRIDGTLIEYLAFYPSQAPDSEAELAALQKAYNTYIKPYPQLHFVDNTSANRQQYLINGTGTGWEYE